MKETLSSENRKDIVRYRLERAEESIKEAKYTYEASMYNLATNRLYYACYYAASALLIFDGTGASTHNGVNVTMYLPLVENFVLSIRNRIDEVDPEYLMK